MPIRFACPNCKQKLSVSSQRGGTSATCPRCKKELVVPNEPTRPVASPPATPGDAVAAPAEPQVETQVSQPGFDADDPYAQFAVYDDAELVYDTDEPIEEADSEVDYDRVAVPRYVLYAQGGLLGLVGLVCFALGVATGGSLFSRSEPIGAQATVVSGTISYTQAGRTSPDSDAVVVIVPQIEQLDERAPAEGLRPDDNPPPATHRGLEIIRTIGGAYARADEAGKFRLELPNRGKYFVLVLSNHLQRKAAEQPKTEDIVKIGRFFEDAADFLGSNRYHWKAELFRSDRELNVAFE